VDLYLIHYIWHIYCTYIMVSGVILTIKMFIFYAYHKFLYKLTHILYFLIIKKENSEARASS